MTLTNVSYFSSSFNYLRLVQQGDGGKEGGIKTRTPGRKAWQVEDRAGKDVQTSPWVASAVIGSLALAFSPGLLHLPVAETDWVIVTLTGSAFQH